MTGGILPSTRADKTADISNEASAQLVHCGFSVQDWISMFGGAGNDAGATVGSATVALTTTALKVPLNDACALIVATPPACVTLSMTHVVGFPCGSIPTGTIWFVGLNALGAVDVERASSAISMQDSAKPKLTRLFSMPNESNRA